MVKSVYTYFLKSRRVPHGELYVMSTSEEWPSRRHEIMLDYPQLFREPVLEPDERIPIFIDKS